MADAFEPPGHPEKEVLSQAPSMFPPNSNYPDSTSSSSVPPPYPNHHQYQPETGMPYPQQYPQQAPIMGYPPQYAPPPGGQPYYPQPGMVYPGQPGYGYQTPQQQQQVLIVGNQPSGMTPVYVVGQSYVSFTGAIVLSCFAYWCFGWLLGGIAFILAMVGQSSAAAGDHAGALRMRNASYGVSIAGIVLGIILIAVLAGVYSSIARNAATTRCTYYYSGYSGYSSYYSCY